MALRFPFFNPTAAAKRREAAGDRRDDRLARQGQRQSARNDRVFARQDARVATGGTVFENAAGTAADIAGGAAGGEPAPAGPDVTLIAAGLAAAGLLYYVAT